MTQAADPQASGSQGTKREWFDLDDEHNTSVYAWGLPHNITEEEFVDLMKKYGVIKKKPEKGSPYNIKLYRDKQTGQPKGDGLCVYARTESVKLAIECLDGLIYDAEHTIHCERAKFQLKGDYDPSKKPRPLDKKAKLKQKKKIEKMLSWEHPKEVTRIKKVILKNMFSPEELEDPQALLELKEDVEEGCKEFCGQPQRIDICEKNPEGVVEIVFKHPDDAEKCVEKMNGRPYAQKIVEATLWDGRTKYKIKETDEEAEKRHEKFQRDIQFSDSDDNNDKNDDDIIQKPNLKGTSVPYDS